MGVIIGPMVFDDSNSALARVRSSRGNQTASDFKDAGG
jgi:hypothetical protein